MADRIKKNIDYTLFSRYKVTRDGEVYGINGRLMHPQYDKNGYLIVPMRDDEGIRYNVKVHRLVATRYIPTNDYALTVNHKDGDKTNNCVENLEWLSVSDNLKHSWSELGRKHFTKAVINSNGEFFESLKEASEQYGVHIQTLSNCLTGRNKTCAGLKWRFANGND